LLVVHGKGGRGGWHGVFSKALGEPLQVRIKEKKRKRRLRQPHYWEGKKKEKHFAKGRSRTHSLDEATSGKKKKKGGGEVDIRSEKRKSRRASLYFDCGGKKTGAALWEGEREKWQCLKT